MPDGGSSLFVPTRIGMARATELSMLGERLPATRALEWGLINRVVADEQLGEETAALAARLAAGPTRSYAGTKRQLNNWLYARMDEQLELEAQHPAGDGLQRRFPGGRDGLRAEAPGALRRQAETASSAARRPRGRRHQAHPVHA